MSEMLRRLLMALSLATIVGVLAAFGFAAAETRANEWTHFGLAYLPIWELRRASLLWVGQAALLVIAVFGLHLLLTRLLGDATRAASALSRSLALGSGALVLALIGYPLNRHAFKELWRLSNGAEFLGVSIPAALLSPKVLMANLAVILLALFVVALLHRLLPWISVAFVRIADTSSTRRVAFVLTVPVLLLVGLVALPGPAVDASSPNVILISADTLRADHLSLYGYSRNTSPALDAFAARGTVFENAIAQANWTLPSHLSLMTSQIPSAHGVQRKEQRLPAFKVTLAEILKNAGYRTQAITGGYFVDARFGFGQGFDDYQGDRLQDLLIDEKRLYGQGPRLSRLLPRVSTWLQRNKDKPFFLFLHFWDPHSPYMPHEGIIEQYSPEYRGPIEMFTHEMALDLKADATGVSAADIQRIRALYDNEIRYMDDSLGELFDYLESSGLLKKSIVIFTSDHGDELLEHGYGHGWSLYDPEIRVPLILVAPDLIPAGTRVAAVVRGIDVLPTILELANISTSDAVAGEIGGQSLVPEWQGRGLERIALSENGRRQALRTSTFKFMRRVGKDGSVSEELYDLLTDPGEESNQVDTAGDRTATLRRKLAAQLVEQTAVHFAGKTEEHELDDATLERLRSLGYVN